MRSKITVFGLLRTAVLALTLGAPWATVATVQAATPSAAASGASRFVPVSPARLIDTRGGARPGAGDVVTVPVAGRAGVPTSAVAVVLNVTATDAAAAGYVTVFPGGTARPTASNVNLPDRGATLANLVTTPLGNTGAVSLFTEVGTHLIVDVFGWYEPVATSDRGRFIPLAPTRAFDSRGGAPVARGGTARVTLPGVPANASAAVMNITAVNAPGVGYWTAYAAGAARPGTSNLNTSSGATVPNQVIVPITDGKVDVFSEIGGNLLVDVFGYFTGTGDPVADVGLFRPLAPTRIMDTRSADNPLGPKVKPYAGWTVELGVVGRAGVPSSASALVTNTTMASARKAGFVTVYPAGTERPNASNLNLGHSGQTVANHAITPLSNRGASLFTDGGGHLIVDVFGYFTGSPRSAYLGPIVNPEPTVSLPARLVVPRMGIDETVREGIDLPIVDEGPGHWPGTAGPGGLGNMTIFGHRVSHTHPFRDLDALQTGDSVYVTAEGVTYRYAIERTDITSPENITVLSPYEAGKRTLTLIACHPPTSVSFRIVVKARFVEITES